MADVLLHQQSFDYALSRAATEVIDWYPSPAPASSSSSSGSRSSSSAAAASPASPSSSSPPRHEAYDGSLGGGVRGWARSSPLAALFKQLPSWHLFISSLGSDTIAETSLLGRRVAFRYGIYGSVLTSSRAYDPSSHVWERMRPVLQLRLSARCVDDSKAIGWRLTFQDVKSIAAVDTMFSFGRRRALMSRSDAAVGSCGGAAPSPQQRQHCVSHFVRFDRQLLTNYTIVNCIEWPDSLVLRRCRIGVGTVVRTRPLGLNIFWGFCIELFKSLVFLLHIDVLRRTCLSIKSSNVFNTGIDAAMRLRINVISFHRTILDIGVAYPHSWRGLRGCWRSSINLGGLSIGGSLDDCSLGEVMLHSGEWLEEVKATQAPRWLTERIANGRRYVRETAPLLSPIAEFSLSKFLINASSSPTMQSIRVHITGGINVRHPNLSTISNPFSASHLYYDRSGGGGGGGGSSIDSSQAGKSSSGGFFDGLKKPSSVHGFFSITFS